MHKKKTPFRLVLLPIFLFVFSSLFAQMSDKEVASEAMRFQKAGMSQEQIVQELVKKGVTPAQIQRIQEQYKNQSGTSSNKTEQSSELSTRSSGETSQYPLRDATPFGQSDTIPPGERIYGQNFFSTENLTFAPNLNMPTPANYVLGAGDEVIIDVWGDSELNLRFTITPDGYINVPGIGRIPLNGMQVEQATARIRSAFSSIYSDLDSPEPRTFLAVSVGNLRSIQVNVMGEVKVPGTYKLNSFASAFHALYSAGGPNNIGSLRNIRIFRNGKVAATIDIYDYLINGDNSGDITLRDGDVVKVDPYAVLVQVTGEVKRPMRYEMRPDETLKTLIDFAGGFKGEAYKENVQLTRKGASEMEIFTLNASQYAQFALMDGDKIGVGNILSKFANMVEIEGAVNRPGRYAIGSDIKTVKNLIDVAGGTTGDAFLYRVLLTREKEDLTRIVESIDLNALMRGEIADVELRKNDKLFVPSVLNLNEDRTVYIGGEVRNPGTYSYADGMSIEDLILRAGGLDEAASLARIDVFRRIKDPQSLSPTANTGAAFSFSIAEGLLKSSDKSFTLQPFDQVVVRRSPGYEEQRMITLKGEVVFEGQYAKLRKDERLSSFVQRSGGLTPEAYIKGARLSRQMSEAEKIRTREALKAKAQLEKDSTWVDDLDYTTQYVGIDLEKALAKPGGQDDIILREGDVLSIPQYDGTVKISGGVMYPNVVTYNKKTTLLGYINQAGGYSRLAMRTKPFVVYQNGKVATGRWAKIEPGCEIIVPEKPDREPMSLQSALSLSTTVASLVLLVSNFIK